MPSNQKHSPPRSSGVAPASAQTLLQQALAWHQQGHLAQAEAAYLQALQLRPRDFDTLHYLGVVYLQTQRIDQGIESIRQALTIDPRQPSAYLNLGNALVLARRHQDAVDAYDLALAMVPQYAEAHGNRGNALKQLGRLEEAVAACDAAIRLLPDFAEAHCTRGHALRQLQRHAQALTSHERAITIAPNYAEAHLGRASTLAELKRHDEAIAGYQRAIALAPDYADAHGNLGVMLQETGRLDEAIEAFKKALTLKPGHAETLGNIGVAYQCQGKLGTAIDHFRMALQANPDHLTAHTNLLFTLTYDARCTPLAYVDEARRYGAKVAASAKPFTNWTSAPAGANPSRLRVGLVSGDLRQHSVGHFLENILAHLDPARIALVAYPTQPLVDELTARIQPRFNTWRCIAPLSDAAAARAIRDDRIDVLIDLSGHTAGNRLPVFAWKPAPVQVSWLGFLASTGVPGMDFMLADPISAPAGHQLHFTEAIHHLPDTVNCFTPPTATDRLTPGPLPARERGHITFGSFQNLAKLTPEVLTLWAEILRRLPDARLRLQNKQMSHEASRLDVLSRLGAVGVTPDRVDLQGAVPDRQDYLAHHAEVDIILDTFPYPGITTTCEALWMGVPTLTLAGDRLLSRQGASLMHCAGLPDWVATDAHDYADRAVSHANDLDGLERLRRALRAQVLASPIFDAPRFASHLESALHALWRQVRSPGP